MKQKKKKQENDEIKQIKIQINYFCKNKKKGKIGKIDLRKSGIKVKKNYKYIYLIINRKNNEKEISELKYIKIIIIEEIN